MSDQAVVLSSEDQELQQVREKWYNAPKLSRWFDLYFDASNKETFHQQTRCAEIAYSLDPTNPVDKKTAYELGSQNSRKLKIYAQRLLEDLGWSREKIIELIAAKAVSSNNSKFVLMLAELGNVYEDKPKNLTQNNIHIDGSSSENTDTEVAATERTEFKKSFKDFINTTYSEPSVPTPNTDPSVSG